MKKVELVSIGRIIRSEGKDGTLKVRLYQKSPGEPFFRIIYIESEGELRDYEVESFRIVRNSPFIKLKGIDSLKQAEALRGREILARPEDFPALESGLYYDFQLLGCLVETVDGRELGRVVELITMGETSLLVVESGGKRIEIPLVEAICRRIDPAAAKIVIDPPEGLLELNEV
ncbi:MAG: 16S rRNA processing protein RimM [Candidatus Saccharicenans subterraneus]|uniref:Ribosome maturation factor RimM n=1 Tax=Candidatus Saccharicenans subterraneus TaxID=2508984 RepID=A0A3E2BJ00_9BACT|nr:MAG: 16S rRNA processing protein RimM [Candidatus Saccharicenans subterraneum]